MGYKCANCNVDFSNKREMVEHMIDVHNSPFVEGDFSDASDNILDQRAKDNTHPKSVSAKQHQDKIKHMRCL